MLERVTGSEARRLASGLHFDGRLEAPKDHAFAR